MEAVFGDFGPVARAFGYTVALFICAGIGSLLLGTLLVALRVGPVGILRKAAAVYVTLIRNTPLLVVFMFFQYAAPSLGITFSWFRVSIGDVDYTSFFATAVVALTLYTSTFVCEALRSGVNSVPLGQAEAARAIGLPFTGSMREVILPQAFRASVPPLASTLIALLKNTTVAAGFGVVEAASQMRVLTNNNADQRWGIFVSVALIFVLLVAIVSFIANRMERRWKVA